jgi:hypothetical protein
MPEDDPVVRAAEVAKQMVQRSASVAKEESAKIDAADEKKPYEVKDAIVASTKLMNIGIAGVTDIGRIAVEQKPPDTVLAMGDYIASVIRRMVSQTGTVASAASIEVEKKKYTPNKWLESWIRLADIGIAGGLEIIETVAAGPARFESQPVRSDDFDMPAAVGGQTRTLVAGPLQRLGTDADQAIKESKISFDPPTLIDPNTTFCVVVDTSGLVSGVYVGEVRAEYPGSPPSAPAETLSISIPV